MSIFIGKRRPSDEKIIIIENENNCMLREENKVEVKFFKLKRNAEIIIRKYFHFAWNLYYLGS